MRMVAEFIVCDNQVSCCKEDRVQGTYMMFGRVLL